MPAPDLNLLFGMPLNPEKYYLPESKVSKNFPPKKTTHLTILKLYTNM